MFRRFYTKLMITAGALLLSVSIGFAQLGEACLPFVETALEQLGDNCSALGRNSVCYGYTLVQAALRSSADEIQFDVPRDRAALAEVAALRTAPLDEDSSTWGIAMMNTQANLPGTLPGQGVIMMLMGDTALANQVPADEAFIAPEPLMIEVLGEGARVRTGAGTNFNILDVLDAGEVVAVDGRSPDNQWVRLVYGNIGGWMSANLLNLSTEQLNSLPALSDNLRAPMQAVYFTSGVGNANCRTAPDALVVQSPQGVRVNISVNEAQISIGSTIVLQIIGNEMVLYVIEGTAEVNNLVVPQGFKAFVPVELREELIDQLLAQGFDVTETVEGGGGTGDARILPSDGLPVITGQWRSCAPISEQDRSFLSTLEGVPAELLNYAIEMPEETDAICGTPEEVLVYELEQQQIINGVDCSNFAATSPLTGMNWGTQTFYWDAANGASSYTVSVTDSNGNVVASGNTTQTNITLNTGTQDLVGSSGYSWSVSAIDRNGRAICTTPPVSVPRGAAPPEVLNPPQPPQNNDMPFVCDEEALEDMAFMSCGEPFIDYDACTFSCGGPPPFVTEPPFTCPPLC